MVGESNFVQSCRDVTECILLVCLIGLTFYPQACFYQLPRKKKDLHKWSFTFYLTKYSLKMILALITEVNITQIMTHSAKRLDIHACV